jgi:methionyl-tRNA synthetase
MENRFCVCYNLGTMSKTRYATTTLPYVNAEPHIGFALEIIQADTIVRYWRMQEIDVFFNTGTDEHGLKIYRKAQEEKKDTQAYADEYAEKFKDLKALLNISEINFIRTTNPKHKSAAQEFWKRCMENDDIYKKMYEIKYCVGCELEKTGSELVDNRCPIHPNLNLEIINEENYFFRWSKYQQRLLDLYEEQPNFVLPGFRLNEIKNFVKKGLEDFSISRLKNKMPWGVPVPNDEEHVMYVWFDALVNYISAIGWPTDMEKFQKYWPVIQFAGKDNLRQQSAMWQAMLMSAGIEPSEQIVIHGFITSNGQKMSKSLGNVINPLDIVNQYGTDTLRYYLLREIPASDDGDFTIRRFTELYNADLANGLGNLVARIAKLIEIKKPTLITNQINTFSPEVSKRINNYQYNLALQSIWGRITELDRLINQKKPWEKEVPQEQGLWDELVEGVRQIGYDLQPFLPETAAKIIEQFKESEISSQSPLFPRL